MNKVQLHRIDLNLLVIFESLMETRSVTHTADKLGKTPSAISHALARLREQLGDPLIVRVDGVMKPSDYALSLIVDIVPILRSIQRAVSAPEPFEPTTSTRVFRVAIPPVSKLISAVLGRIGEEAPGVRLEWLRADIAAYQDVADGLIDLAHLGGETRLPEGLNSTDEKPYRLVSFVRNGHPALDTWNVDAWKKWPHLQMALANAGKNPVPDQIGKSDTRRKIGAIIPEFSAIPSLIASTNMIATFPSLVCASDIETLGLRALDPPVALPSLRVRFFWSSRLETDPASRWLRDCIVGTHRELHVASDALVDLSIGAIDQKTPRKKDQDQAT